MYSIGYIIIENGELVGEIVPVEGILPSRVGGFFNRFLVYIDTFKVLCHCCNGFKKINLIAKL
jgi:hypothetical protein